MNEQFHESNHLCKDALTVLMTRHDHQALGRFILQYGLLLGSATIVVLGVERDFSPWIILLAQVIFALMTMGMFALVHETAHNTAFKSRFLNRLVCWLASVPIYYTPTGFREFHFAHHRHTHDPCLDPEIAVGGKPAPGVTSNLAIYLVFASGLPLMMYKIMMVLTAALGRPQAVWDKFLFYVTPRARQGLTWQARFALAVHMVWIAAGFLWLNGLLYLLLGQLLGHALLAFYIMAEHNGLPHEGSILERTRTTHTTFLLKWLMWNMPYHAEHHAYPAIPWHALPKLHRLLGSELPHIQEGYPAFHLKVIHSVAQGQAFQDK